MGYTMNNRTLYFSNTTISGLYRNGEAANYFAVIYVRWKLMSRHQDLREYVSWVVFL